MPWRGRRRRWCPSCGRSPRCASRDSSRRRSRPGPRPASSRWPAPHHTRNQSVSFESSVQRIRALKQVHYSTVLHPLYTRRVAFVRSSYRVTLRELPPPGRSMSRAEPSRAERKHTCACTVLYYTVHGQAFANRVFSASYGTVLPTLRTVECI